MSDTNTEARAAGSILDQVQAEINKAAREALKAKVKGLVQKRMEAEKVVAGINLEIAKAIEDFEKGL